MFTSYDHIKNKITDFLMILVPKVGCLEIKVHYSKIGVHRSIVSRPMTQS